MAAVAASARASVRARVTLRLQHPEVPASDRLIWDPAGEDRELSWARQDVAAGRFFAARDLLAETGRNWDLRCQRLLVLAGAGLDGVAADAWVRVDPRSPDARMFIARIQVLQAVAAVRKGSPMAPRLIEAAKRACLLAQENSRDSDPAPNVALLHLAGVDPVAQEPPDPQALDSVRGPWHLMRTVWSQDAYNREGHQRMLIAVQTASGTPAMYAAAQWLAAYARHGSSMHLLPLVARAASLRLELADAGGDVRRLVFNRELQWTGEAAFQEVEGAYTRWFANPARRSSPVVMSDLHLLAHAAYMVRHRSTHAKNTLAIARTVLDETGAYACHEPWALTAAGRSAGEELLAARRACGAGPPH